MTLYVRYIHGHGEVGRHYEVNLSSAKNVISLGHPVQQSGFLPTKFFD